MKGNVNAKKIDQTDNKSFIQQKASDASVKNKKCNGQRIVIKKGHKVRNIIKAALKVASDGRDEIKVDGIVRDECCCTRHLYLLCRKRNCPF